VQQVDVEILVSPSCPTARSVTDAVRVAAEETGVVANVTERVVATIAEAQTLRMPGSPTIRVGGRDVEPDAEALEDFGLG
jgi:hypothetical protein